MDLSVSDINKLMWLSEKNDMPEVANFLRNHINCQIKLYWSPIDTRNKNGNGVWAIDHLVTPAL